MLFFKRSLYFLFSVGFFLNITFLGEKVSSKRHGCKKDHQPIKLGTWEKAKRKCSHTDLGAIEDLQDDERDSYYLSSAGVWLGLKKSAAVKIELCQSANVNERSYQNMSCTRRLLSVCVKYNASCEHPWTKNGSQCFLTVQEKPFFSATAHCITLNSELYPINATLIPPFNATQTDKTSLFWTGKFYEITVNPNSGWFWASGSLFKEWDQWRIEIDDVGCRGCAFWKNGSIHLTYNCSQNMSYLCEKHRENNITFSSALNKQQLSWVDANRTCGTRGLLQLYQRDDNPFNAININRTADNIVKWNMSYWLGIYSRNCLQVLVKGLKNSQIDEQSILQNISEQCPFVENNFTDSGDCIQKNHAICIRPVKTCHNKTQCKKLECNNRCCILKGSPDISCGVSKEAKRLCKRVCGVSLYIHHHKDLLSSIQVERLIEKWQENEKPVPPLPASELKMYLKAKEKIKKIIGQKCGDRYPIDSSKAKKCSFRDSLDLVNQLFDCSTKPYKSSNQAGFVCKKKDSQPECSQTWNPISNKQSWKEFSTAKMTWEAAYVFCLQQKGYLADFTDFQAIKRNLSNGKRYWIRGDKAGQQFIKNSSYDWYWSNGTSFYTSHGLWQFSEMRNTSGERCAYAYKENRLFWKDSSCDKCRWFFCTPCETEECWRDRRRRKHEYIKGNTTNFQRRIRNRRFAKKHASEVFLEMNKTLLELINSWDFRGSFNSSINRTTVAASITTLRRLKEFTDNTTSIPKETIGKLCFEQPNCTVTRLKVLSKDLTLNIKNFSNFSALAPSDVIVLDYIVNGTKISKLLENESVSLNFSKKLNNISREHVNCLFLDSQSGWNTTGMEVGSIDGGTIQCLTDHLSTFTMVLLNPETSDEPANTSEFVLNIITYIGSGMSLTALLFTCIVYVALYKDLRILTTSRHLVHLNLQIALGLTQIAFLSGGSATHNKIACKTVAILVHYFSLAGFAWILLESVMLYLKLVAVYGGEFVRIKNFMIFGWGFPLVFVGISAAAENDAYGNENWCWLSYQNGFLWIAFAPVIIVTLVGLVTVIAVVRVLFIASKAEDANTKKTIISAARGVVILFPTIGLSWGFSVIAVNHDAMVWKYLYAIITSLQGFLVFLIYGICNAEIRQAVARKLGFDVHFSSSTT